MEKVLSVLVLFYVAVEVKKEVGPSNEIKEENIY